MSTDARKRCNNEHFAPNVERGAALVTCRCAQVLPAPFASPRSAGSAAADGAHGSSEWRCSRDYGRRDEDGWLRAAYGSTHWSIGPEEWIARDFFQDRRGGVFVDVGSADAREGRRRTTSRHSWAGRASPVRCIGGVWSDIVSHPSPKDAVLSCSLAITRTMGGHLRGEPANNSVLGVARFLDVLRGKGRRDGAERADDHPQRSARQVGCHARGFSLHGHRTVRTDGSGRVRSGEAQTGARHGRSAAAPIRQLLIDHFVERLLANRGRQVSLGSIPPTSGLSQSSEVSRVSSDRGQILDALPNR